MRKKQMLKMIAGCATDKGTVRLKNQDRVVCHTASLARGNYAAACICDGIGSYEYGEIAAEIVTRGVTLWFRGVEDGKLAALTQEELAEDFDVTLRELNELVCEQKERDKMDLGCTMSALLVINGQYYVFHVGDSRIYLVGDAVYQLTRDEVTYTEAHGAIKKKLANCIGKSKDLWMNRLSGTVSPGETFIMGSDGLFHQLEEARMYEDTRMISTDSQAQKLCRRWIEEVERLGERDNISCAILKQK